MHTKRLHAHAVLWGFALYLNDNLVCAADGKSVQLWENEIKTLILIFVHADP